MQIAKKSLYLFFVTIALSTLAGCAGPAIHGSKLGSTPRFTLLGEPSATGRVSLRYRQRLNAQAVDVLDPTSEGLMLGETVMALRETGLFKSVSAGEFMPDLNIRIDLVDEMKASSATKVLAIATLYLFPHVESHHLTATVLVKDGSGNLAQTYEIQESWRRVDHALYFPGLLFGMPTDGYEKTLNKMAKHLAVRMYEDGLFGDLMVTIERGRRAPDPIEMQLEEYPEYVPEEVDPELIEQFEVTPEPLPETSETPETPEIRRVIR